MKHLIPIATLLLTTACGTSTVYVDRPVEVPYPVERYVVPADLPMPETVVKPHCDGIDVYAILDEMQGCTLSPEARACLQDVATWIHQLETHAAVSEQTITDHNAALAEMRAEHADP